MLLATYIEGNKTTVVLFSITQNDAIKLWAKILNNNTHNGHELIP
jgi:hypothetical protein